MTAYIFVGDLSFINVLVQVEVWFFYCRDSFLPAALTLTMEAVGEMQSSKSITHEQWALMTVEQTFFPHETYLVIDSE